MLYNHSLKGCLDLKTYLPPSWFTWIFVSATDIVYVDFKIKHGFVVRKETIKILFMLQSGGFISMLKRKCLCPDCSGRLRACNTMKRHCTLYENGMS